MLTIKLHFEQHIMEKAHKPLLQIYNDQIDNYINLYFKKICLYG